MIIPFIFISWNCLIQHSSLELIRSDPKQLQTQIKVSPVGMQRCIQRDDKPIKSSPVFALPFPVRLLPVQMDACFTDLLSSEELSMWSLRWWNWGRLFDLASHAVWINRWAPVFVWLYSRSGKIGASSHLEEQPVLSSEAMLKHTACRCWVKQGGWI